MVAFATTVFEHADSDTAITQMITVPKQTVALNRSAIPPNVR